jgi:hypothetical protein
MDKRIQWSHQIFYFALIALVIGMPLSVFLISVSQFGLAISWLLAGNYMQRLKNFFTGSIGLCFTLFFAMHLIGLFYTTDIKYAFNDIRIKLPLILLPFFLSTMPTITNKQWRYVLHFFMIACFISTCISTYIWAGLSNKTITDTRQISIFISHIRLSLLICLSIYLSIYFFNISDNKKKYRWIYPVLLIWFVVFLCILESFTGLIILTVTLCIYVTYAIIKAKRWSLALSVLIMGSSLIFGIAFKLNKDLTALNIEKQLNIQNPLTTALGNIYTHERFKGDIENGWPIFMNVAYTELDSAWQTRSRIAFDSVDARGQWIKYTLLRYMTSKGLMKDAAGLQHLDNNDVKNIEAGIASINELNTGTITARYKATLYEVNNALQGGNPSGHSVTMRLLFWQASWHIIKENMLFGVGTGDNKIALDAYYATNTPQLFKQFWLRSHNQFIAITVSFGIIGLFVFFVDAGLSTNQTQYMASLFILYFLYHCSLLIFDRGYSGNTSRSYVFCFF